MSLMDDQVKCLLVDLESSCGLQQRHVREQGQATTVTAPEPPPEAPVAATFVPYEKIPASSAAFKSQGLTGRTPFVVTEKVHGANFVLVVDIVQGLNNSGGCAAPPRVRFAKRSAILGAGEDFYGVRTYDRGRLAAALAASAEGIFRGLPRNSEELVQVAVHGELFGGFYPGVSPATAACNAVQTGVWYSDRLAFIAFDVAVQTRQRADCTSGGGGGGGGSGYTERRYYLDFDAARAVCEANGLLFAAPLFIGPFEACLAAVDPEKLATSLPGRLGLPSLPESSGANWAEGVVIKRLREQPGAPKRFVLKRKAARFAEKAYGLATKPRNGIDHSGGGGGVGGPLAMLGWELCASVGSTARLEAVLSKDGRPDWADRSACVAVLRALVVDAVADLDEEYRAALAGMRDEDRRKLLRTVREQAKATIVAYATARCRAKH